MKKLIILLSICCTIIVAQEPIRPPIPNPNPIQQNPDIRHGGANTNAWNPINPPPVVYTNAMLLENGQKILKEDGSKLLLENYAN